MSGPLCKSFSYTVQLSFLVRSTVGVTLFIEFSGYLQQTWVVRGNSLPPHRVASLWLGRARWVFTTGSIRSSQRKNEAPCNFNGCAFFLSSSAAFHLQFPEKWSCAVASVTAMTATRAEVAMRASFIKLCLSNLNARPSRGWLLPRRPALCVFRGDRWRPSRPGP